jgi:tryptophan-rich sensory protein
VYWVAGTLLVGALAAFLTRNSMDVYETLEQPALSPPGWLFLIVWTILYILMGIGAAIVYQKGKGIESSSAVKLYIVQLIFNFLWTIVFFNLGWYLFAYIWLMILWVMIIVMIVKFYRISPIAAYMQIPYLLWVTFASYLNLMIYLLN